MVLVKGRIEFEIQHACDIMVSLSLTIRTHETGKQWKTAPNTHAKIQNKKVAK